MTEHEKEGESMKERILARIERRDVAMKPRIVLALKAVALALLVLLALTISVFLFNFLFFFLRINVLEGHIHVLRFLFIFPWTLLAIDFGLLVLSEALLRQFRFAYRRPVVLTLFLLAALTLSLGLAIDRTTRFNETMEGSARYGRLPPPIGDMYRHARHF